MWSGASVAHTTPVQEDLGLILTQTQIALSDLSSRFFLTKTIPLSCNIGGRLRAARALNEVEHPATK